MKIITKTNLILLLTGSLILNLPAAELPSVKIPAKTIEHLQEQFGNPIHKDLVKAILTEEPSERAKLFNKEKKAKHYWELVRKKPDNLFNTGHFHYTSSVHAPMSVGFYRDERKTPTTVKLIIQEQVDNYVKALTAYADGYTDGTWYSHDAIPRALIIEEYSKMPQILTEWYESGVNDACFNENHEIIWDYEHPNKMMHPGLLGVSKDTIPSAPTPTTKADLKMEEGRE